MCDPSLTRAILSTLEVRSHKKRYTNGLSPGCSTSRHPDTEDGSRPINPPVPIFTWKMREADILSTGEVDQAQVTNAVNGGLHGTVQYRLRSLLPVNVEGLRQPVRQITPSLLNTVLTNRPEKTEVGTSISPEPHVQSLPNFLCALPIAVARSSSCGVTQSRSRDNFGGFLPTDNALYSIACVTHTKTAEPIQMPFGFMTRVGP